MNDPVPSRDVSDAARVERYRRLLGELATLTPPRPDACLPVATTRRFAMLIADARDAVRNGHAARPIDDDAADFTMEHAP